MVRDMSTAAVADTSIAATSNALGMACRFCGERADHVFVDLGMSPLCETYLTLRQLNEMEPFYHLLVTVCPRCFLVQLGEYVSPQHIFSEYA